VEFELREWVGREELKERILGLGDGAGMGDIFVRTEGSSRSESHKNAP
jgi:hypothetical protein